MKYSRIFLGVACLLFLSSESIPAPAAPQDQPQGQETIVAIRHAEKPVASLGQLTCRGLNRALALPKVLISRYGRPNRIYAPDPSARIGVANDMQYSYVRPLITIEPTAIQMGMPVNALIGFKDIRRLQRELTAPENKNSVIFIVWEHALLNRFAQRMLKSYGVDPSAVPDWPDNEYDRIYVFNIQQTDGKPRLTFTVDHQGLNDSLSDTCPGQ